MRKGHDGGKKNGGKKRKKEKTDENSGHYVIASSRPPERRPLERRTLAPKNCGRKGFVIPYVSVPFFCFWKAVFLIVVLLSQIGFHYLKK